MVFMLIATVAKEKGEDQPLGRQGGHLNECA